MLESIFTNVFGRPKNKTHRSSQQHDSIGGQPLNPASGTMTGPFSTSAPQMPQPPSLPYPPASPYPGPQATASHYYPSIQPLPFSAPPLPTTPGSSQPNPYNNNYGTMANKFCWVDQVPFEAKLTINSSNTLVSLDQLFKEIKRTTDIVDRADAYLRSSQSDYDFKVEQGLVQQ